MRRTFDRLVKSARQFGPVTVYAQKSRIVFMVRVRFGGVTVKKQWLDFGLWLTRRVHHPLLTRMEVFGPHSFGAHFRLRTPQDVDRSLEALIGEGTRQGCKNACGHGRPAGRTA